MPRPINAVRYLIRTLQEIALLRLIIVVICLIAFGAVGLWITEPQVDVTNALWWSIVTLTTVGYGDISPTTTGGRLVGAVVMVLGIGVLGAFTGQVASLLTERRRLKDKGLLVNANLSGHLIFSGWGPHARSVYDSIRADPRGESQTIVLIADREESPVPDDLNFIFVQGKTDEQTLGTASIESADTFIAFGDPRLDEEARDAKVVLHLLTVETINPDVHTIAEVELRSTIEHCRRAHADEVIVGSEFTSHLLSRASIDHGISNVLSELMDPNTGMELFKVPVAQRFVGEDFGDVLAEVKKSHDCLLIGVEARTDTGSPRVLTNPPLDRTMESSDTLILMGRDSVSQL